MKKVENVLKKQELDRSSCHAGRKKGRMKAKCIVMLLCLFSVQLLLAQKVTDSTFCNPLYTYRTPEYV